jgi:hypothetical protein
MNPIKPPVNRRANLRKSPRGKVRITCHKGSFDLGLNLGRGLLDASESGARLIASENLKKGQEILLGLEGPGQSRPLKVPAVVIWSVEAADGTFCIGAELQKRLRYSDLQKLT